MTEIGQRDPAGARLLAGDMSAAPSHVIASQEPPALLGAPRAL